MKIYKNTLFTGTVILILTGLLTRFLGFYYRIFLSSKIGAEAIGLYQMIFPIYILCMSISSSGIQLGICRQVSKNEKQGKYSLLAGLLISLPLSIICSLILFVGSNFLASNYLNESRCQPLLILLCFCLPLATIHNCINGYFLGKQNTVIPGITQLIEQIGRMLVVYLFFSFFSSNISSNPKNLATIAVIGLLASELMSAFFSVMALAFTRIKHLHSKIQTLIATDTSHIHHSLQNNINELTKLSLPITLTNISLSIVHSVEATAIPLYLRRSGLSISDAISVYGTLTAMALPFILFPSTITCAVAKMLLPIISKAKSKNNRTKINHLTSNTLKYCSLFGIFCTIFFILTGSFIGTHFFHSTDAGTYITILAWLCPFIFISSTLGSILHGLGFAKATFYHNLYAALLRLSFIIFLIPHFGIKGYLWGLLASELLCSILHTISVVKYLQT